MTYIVTARTTAGSLSLVVQTAQLAIDKVEEFHESRFSAILVLDERGREVANELLAVKAAEEKSPTKSVREP